jgi:hypothetical protein
MSVSVFWPILRPEWHSEPCCAVVMLSADFDLTQLADGPMFRFLGSKLGEGPIFRV